MNNFSEIEMFECLEGPRGEAEKYLNRITLLQEKLNMEEKNLMALVEVHGVEVLNSDVFQ